MTKKVLLIGGTGFVGKHLQKYLLARGDYEVEASGHEVDIRLADQVDSFIRDAKPEAVVHMAAVTNIPESIDNPRKTYDINVMGTLNVLTALEKNRFKGCMLYVSSSEVYGHVAENKLPLTEESEIKPINPYGTSKVAAESLCKLWSDTKGIRVVIARPFNHIGPGQRSNFVIPDFTKQILEIKRGQREAKLYVGDIDVTRDFVDVRDVAHAYSLLIEKGHSSKAYNVCSNKEISIRSMLMNLLDCAEVDAEILQDPSRLRSSEQRRALGCAKSLFNDTGWAPEISLRETLKDTLKYYEENDHE